MHQQNSVSDRPVIDLSDAMTIDDPFSDNIITGSTNSGAVLNSGASPDWDRPLRNPIPHNMTPAPVSLHKGKICEINPPLPAEP